MRNASPFLFSLLLIMSCGPKEPDHGGIVTTQKLEPLMYYFDLDSMDANGKPTYHTIPDVELISQNGKPFQTSSLKGKVVLVDFFFASCGGICPKMTSQLTRVQARFGNEKDFAIVSYTVDPERDSAIFLQDYAMLFKADTAQWKFVTGEKKKLYDLARYGYYLPVEPGNGDSEDFIHSDQFVLVDRDAHIRGFYNGTDSLVVDSLMRDLKELIRRK
jgi:protein SCO1